MNQDTNQCQSDLFIDNLSNQDTKEPVKMILQKQEKQTQEFTLIPSSDIVENKDENSNTYTQGYSFPMRLLWFHLISIFRRWRKIENSGRKIQIDDIPILEEESKVEHSIKCLKNYLKTMDINQLTLFKFLRIIALTYRNNILVVITFAMLEALSKLSSPYCTAKIITFVQEGEINQAFKWVVFLIIAHFGVITFGQQSWTKTQKTSVQVRLGLINLLYDKVSNLSAYSIKKANIGKIINMISSDFSSIEWNIAYFFQTWISPIILGLACTMLVQRLGIVGILSVVLLICLFPLQQWILKKAAVYTSIQTQKRDKKVKKFSEMIEGIRIIKMYGWEKAFIKVINKLRDKEVRCTIISYVIHYLEQVISLNGPIFIALICLIIVDYQQEIEVNTALIFYTIELINLISGMVIKYIGQLLTFFQDFKILFQRYKSILSIENVQMQCIDSQQFTPNVDQNTVLFMENFSAYWQTENLESQTPVLKDINLSVQLGETISIIGQIGSGKTSLLFSIMKEIPRYKGLFFSTSKISYVEQEPYIFQGSVRDNILFGKTFESEYYQKVVEACCLIDDFNQLNQGDQTIIGERGANISGGQRARVSLARAVYANNDLYLLDDPLSAVDSKIAKLIFNNLINGLLKEKAVILVTHQLNYALRCQKIAVFDKGSILIQGKPQEINFSDTALANFIKEQLDEQENINEVEDSQCTNCKNEYDNQDQDSDSTDISQSYNDNSKMESAKLQKLDLVTSKSNENSLLSGSVKKEEESIVTFNTYKQFLQTNPKPFFILVVLLVFIIQEMLFTVFYKYLAQYDSNNSTFEFYSMSLLIYFAFFVFKFMQISLLSYFVLKTTQRMTQKMIVSLTKAQSIIYDDIPSGTIINKFANDINILDKQLPSDLHSSVDGVLHFINIVLTVILFNYLIIIPIIIEIVIFYHLLKSTKSLLMRTKQLDLENKSPIFQFFQSSLGGLLVINLYGQKEQFQNRMSLLMNNSIRTFNAFFFISRLFSVLMQYTLLTSSGICITIVLFLSKQGHGEFGQALSFFIIVINFFHLTLRAIINTDTFLMSSERAFSIINLPSEGNSIEDSHSNSTQRQKNQIPTMQQSIIIEDVLQDQTNTLISFTEINKLHNNKTHQNMFQQWPYKGELIFENVHMRYKQEFQHVLKGISFHAKPRERVAIVGRTGAGKSSIISSLFRMTEIDSSTDSGQSKIIYDEKDIKNIELNLLRRNIGIIPQNPFVFSGSVYQNIDPLEEYSESQIIKVLTQTGLYELIEKLPNGIHTDMSDSSSIFSLGQKQLVCLARVMLRSSKLIVLDEATANVDMKTDQKIQYLLKEMFKDATIITIAHRLNTIADYDKIIVLDQGRVIEAAEPFQLLALRDTDKYITNMKSQFAQMVLHTGPKNADQIFQMCKQSYQEKKKNI